MSHLNEVELAKLMLTALRVLDEGERVVVSFVPAGDWTMDTVVDHSQAYRPLGKRLVWTPFKETIDGELNDLWELSYEQMTTPDVRICTREEAEARIAGKGQAVSLTD